MKNFIKLNWFKIGILVVILIAIISAVFSYQSHVMAEKDMILKQQIDKKEIEDKEYAADRRKDCLAVYEVEGKKWNNVTSWNYNASDDACEITYKRPVSERKSQTECNLELKENNAIMGTSSLSTWPIKTYLHCVDGTFSNSF